MPDRETFVLIVALTLISRSILKWAGSTCWRAWRQRNEPLIYVCWSCGEENETRPPDLRLPTRDEIAEIGGAVVQAVGKAEGQ